MVHDKHSVKFKLLLLSQTEVTHDLGDEGQNRDDQAGFI